MDEVYKNLRFCISEKPIDVKYIYQEVLHKVGNVVITHGDDDLLSRRILCVKIVDSGLYSILFLFLFLFFLSFLFLFLEQLGLGLIGHAVTSVTS